MARSLPERSFRMTEGRLSNMTLIWLPSRSIVTGALAFQAICCISTLVMDLNRSPERWVDLPLFKEPKFSFTGWAFA